MSPRAIAMVAAAALLAGCLTAAPPAAAAAGPATDSSTAVAGTPPIVGSPAVAGSRAADNSPAVADPAASVAAAVAPAVYDVPARSGDGSAIGPEITVAARAFPAGPRFVASTVVARHLPGASARATMLSVTLTCGAESVQATTNVLTTTTLAPRRVMTDATACTVTARAAVDHPTATDGLRVTATLTATAIGSGAVGYTPAGFPTLMRPGSRLDATPVTYAVAAGTRSVTVAGDIKVTTCTSVGGSRENGSPYLCAASRVRPGGTTLRVALVAQQRSADGGYCALRTVSVRTVRVDRTTHHVMISQFGTYALSTAPGCARTVRVKLAVRVLGGADLVVHRRGTITSVYR